MRNHTDHGYDQLACRYHLIETLMFGSRLKEARTALLSSIPACRSALILGDGDGRLLEALLTTQPECQITSIDQSQKMLEIQQQRLSNHPRRNNVRWIQQDARRLEQFDHQFDLLVSAFFLDCFTRQEIEMNLQKWLNSLRPDGYFYFVDFQEPKTGWKRLRGKLYLAAMHSFFRCYTNLPNRKLVDLNGALDQCPLELVTSENVSHDLISARLYRMTSA
ncbi:MAG: hypothetical protein CBE00_04815 [Planctomycetaceae bacterium TMED240]|nr:SAM-dependent methyltransferase [Rhodopirellula sp.]OUX07542.1 MAG: hypothetical protein CBE00_04815 [Planctomycetaceae bacterium TMED240]